MYQAAIEPAGGQFVVNFAYGRRGSTLTTGTKTSSPVDYDTAKKIYTKLVGEKKAKGYTEGADGTPYQHTDKQAIGDFAPTAESRRGSRGGALLRDDDYCAQEKFDGRHLLIRKEDERLEGINKKGLIVGLPQTVANDVRCISGSFIPDGESVGDDYHTFDLLECGAKICGHCHIASGWRVWWICCCQTHDTPISGWLKPPSRPAEDPTVGTVAGGTTRGHRVQTAGRALHTRQAQQRRTAVEIQVRRHVVGNSGQGEHPAQRGDQPVQRQELGFVRQRDHPGQPSDSTRRCHSRGSLKSLVPDYAEFAGNAFK